MTDPNDDLGRRLDRLAPASIDVDAALAGVRSAGRRRQQRHRQLVAAAMAVVLVALLSGAALARQGADDADVVASDPDHVQVADDAGDPSRPAQDPTGTTSLPGTTVVAGPLVVDPSTTVPLPTGSPRVAATTPDGYTKPDGPVDEGGLAPEPFEDDQVDPQPPQGSEMAFAIRSEQPSLRAGERMTLWVDVTNRGPVPIKVNAGECGSVEVLGPNGANLGAPVPGWSGAAGSLPGYAAGHDLAVHAYPTEPSWGGMQRMCSPDNHQPTLGYTTTLQPGASTSHVYVWDASFLPPVGDPVTAVEIRARVRFPDSDRPPEYGSLVVPVVDEPGAHASPTSFLAAVDADPVVRTWLAEHPAASGYRVTLAYARGSFELWIDDGTRRLRVRGAPATGSIVEIRSLSSDWLPSDDPAAWSPPPDEAILFPT